MAVVDSQARVMGVSGLRVVDASAFPFLPPGHPQATVCKYHNMAGSKRSNANEVFVDALAEKIVSDILNLRQYSL